MAYVCVYVHLIKKEKAIDVIHSICSKAKQSFIALQQEKREQGKDIMIIYPVPFNEYIQWY